jgi:quercetin dioxygenase-like cupin family protein
MNYRCKAHKFITNNILYKVIMTKGHLIKPLSQEEKLSFPSEIKIKLELPFVDPRGSIQPLVDVSMESCVLIYSKKGSQRANHFHQTDWHYCYVLSGEIEYYSRDVGSDSPPQITKISKGEMFFTGPMEEHTMLFLEDTEFLTFGRNSRSQEVYEADIVRIPSLVEPS